ncbi:MAG: hypothetical protein ACREDX_10980 [Aestuariivirga sp.]
MAFGAVRLTGNYAARLHHTLPAFLIAAILLALAPAWAVGFDGARIDLLNGGTSMALALKALGGVPPFTWLVDGVPVVTLEPRRDSSWEGPGRGFARLSVIDAHGDTATATIRVE